MQEMRERVAFPPKRDSYARRHKSDRTTACHGSLSGIRRRLSQFREQAVRARGGPLDRAGETVLLIPSQRGFERRAVLERRSRENGAELEDIPAMQGVEAGGPTIEGLPSGSLPRKVCHECSI